MPILQIFNRNGDCSSHRFFKLLRTEVDFNTRWSKERWVRLWLRHFALLSITLFLLSCWRGLCSTLLSDIFRLIKCRSRIVMNSFTDS